MDANRGIPEQTMVVLLAAGKGTRMGRSDLVKVCFEINSVPAINRQIAVFKRQRFSRFLVVVGAQVDQVLETVNREHPGVLFVHQEPQLGTGHAAKAAAEALQTIGYRDYVLVTMGDKYIEENALAALVDGYVKQRADLALLTIPKTHSTEASAGRVIVAEDGQAQDIVEQVDLARQTIADDLRAMLAREDEEKRGTGTVCRNGPQGASHKRCLSPFSPPLTGADVLAVVGRHISRPQKQQAAVAELMALGNADGPVDRAKLEKILQAGKYNLEIGGKRYPGRQIEKLSAGVNPSLYLMKADVFYQGVGMIRNDNAQGEYYITDVVRLLSGIRDSGGGPRYRVRAVPVDRPEWVQSFNSPDELLAIQDYVRKRRLERRAALEPPSRPRLRPAQYATVRQWLARIGSGRPALKRWLRKVYGQHEDLHRQKCKDLCGVLECYGKHFGMDQKVCVVRRRAG